MQEDFQYLNERQVHEFTQLGLSTLRNYRHLGKGMEYVKVGKTVRYRSDDVLRFMERNRIKPREER